MNNTQPKFKESDIPYQSLEKVGLSKMDVLNLDKQNLESLLSGKRTSLFNIKGIDNSGDVFDFKGKLSLFRNEDNTVGLMVHPVRNEIKNDINLKPEELDKLKKGEIVPKSVNGEKYLVQLDKETNELLKVKSRDINIPTHIKDVELGATQREQMKQGLPVTIASGNELIQVKLDLNNPKGLSFKDDSFEQKQKIAFDKENPGVIGFVHTDKNRQEFTDHQNKDHKPHNSIKH